MHVDYVHVANGSTRQRQVIGFILAESRRVQTPKFSPQKSDRSIYRNLIFEFVKQFSRVVSRGCGMIVFLKAIQILLKAIHILLKAILILLKGIQIPL